MKGWTVLMDKNLKESWHTGFVGGYMKTKNFIDKTCDFFDKRKLEKLEVKKDKLEKKFEILDSKIKVVEKEKKFNCGYYIMVDKAIHIQEALVELNHEIDRLNNRLGTI